ncbi:FKBP-type peptidyl-prolyl cis-trans isomerase [Algoriphagus persicinus]|uniref:FKBP-type peptidyl-prolyl cis-trans isomerase n=1 Tax=Algoriphagus persicinus TaxID=3108754 RepID=UPI002B3C6927|nr:MULTISPECIES: FKBP-type peptidyl-prolyl cis-trans isomerase [unclassified Algoriphagus]MEB2779564.1 FKBP-type peptidyl-prolyl cis-trans isomerase [Algoriphagus sp. C2-6-M1]MEB2786018.1 FKBP-type peptidyl-prolyl cis-trans isomerase [Algoriphagus sp. E1-3-M2]
MKNSKSLLAILALLVGASTLTSCKKTKVTEKDSIEYTYIKEGNEKAPNGEFLLYNLQITTDSDSVIYSTTDQPFPGYMQANDSMQITNGMDEIFLNLRKGDSIAFESNAKIIFGGNYPPFMKEDDVVKVRLGAFEIMNEEAIQIYFEKVMAAEEIKREERAKERLVEEDKIIQDYIKDNDLTAQKTESGLYYVIEEEGTGDPVAPGTTMTVDYAGYLLDGTLFDTSIESIARENNTFSEGRPYAPLPVTVGMGQVIPGWDEGLLLLKKGSKGKFLIPSPLGYGENGAGAMIPPNSVLVFDVDVADVQ